MFEELPATTRLLSEYPYPQLPDPAENVAERLVALVHSGYNRDVWAVSPERLKRYWTAFSEHCEGSANTNRVSVWWTQVTEGLVIPPLNDPEFLHEKNLLLSPSTLSTPVQDQEVLQVFRQQTPYLVDRARMWVRTRRAAKTQGNKKS